MIQTQGLVFRFKGASVDMRFPDVAVPQGGTLLVRGPSGCGKSTWLGLVSGLLTPDAGAVTVAQKQLHPLSGAQRDRWRSRHLGVLPQRLYLSESLSVYDNLALVYFAAGLQVAKAAIGERLAALGVADMARRRPAQLSGGQAQRVALARALLLRPAVVLADEPTASLDDGACHAALCMLKDHTAAQGATLVVATHDARAVKALAGAIELQWVPGGAS